MRAGTVIADRYRLKREIGSGGMGVVWLGEHTALHSLVAIKFLSAELSRSESAARRFLLEAKAVAELRSLHVVQVFDYGIADGRPFMVMEYLDGETLADRLLRERYLRPEVALRILSQIARAIDKAHQSGVVHRDLKPANIVLLHEGDPFVKVVDFGVAKLLYAEGGTLTTTGTMLGTPYYMSPEQIEGGQMDGRSDLWALAVIAYQCVTGQLPFDGSCIADVLMAVVNGAARPPSELAMLPLGFDDWFERATRKNPDERFQSALELNRELELSLGEPGENRERRSAKRSPSSIPAALDGRRDMSSLGLTRDISESGALLLTRRAYQPGQRVHIDLYLKGDVAISTAGQVVRISSRSGSDARLWRYRVAIRFEKRIGDLAVK